MKLFYILLILIPAVFAYPYLRIVAKRMLLYLRIKKVCRRRGYTLKSSRLGCFLATNQRKTWDFSIETETEILCVKLFAAKHKKSILKLTDKNRLYYFTNSLWLFSRWGQTTLTYNTKLRALPDCDFGSGEVKKRTNILLIHPKCHEIHGISEEGDKRILAVGDTLRGMRLESGKTFLEYL